MPSLIAGTAANAGRKVTAASPLNHHGARLVAGFRKCITTKREAQATACATPAPSGAVAATHTPPDTQPKTMPA
eukprot:CAMPEP_0172004988 /NCGR_PEP_ID=MMETSP1041-20130122/4788_1 /TAXON_ID=464988 /ORGANISM="Hemiselmis andersenii, Strain CCMP439" /LENGTH=73 /DNA_ID=CAMNT_0012658915 /DNA_START=141 /DNA_END=362 /DNA_ORIENTATION=+